MNDQNWKEQLTPEQYRVLREKGTEVPFTGEFVDHHKDGMYTCAGCGAQLFESGTKYDSGSGWPSFDQAIDGAVELREDHSAGMIRTEVVCANCEGHLGHVFNDGPTNTGKRFCVNSCSLGFKENS